VTMCKQTNKQVLNHARNYETRSDISDGVVPGDECLCGQACMFTVHRCEHAAEAVRPSTGEYAHT
jgi:hypothetical protein